MNNLKVKGLLSLTLISLFLLSGLADVSSARTSHTAEMTANVVIFSNREKNALSVSLGLDDRIKTTLFNKSDDFPGAIQSLDALNDADVLVFDTFLPADPADAVFLVNLILTKNLGVIFFGGNYTRESLNVFEAILPAYFTVNRDVLNTIVDESLSMPIGLEDTAMNYFTEYIYNSMVEFTILDNQIQVSATAEMNNSIFIEGIAWQSCPLLKQRFSTFAKKPNTHTLVEVPDTKEPLVVIGNISAFTSENTQATVLFISTGVAEYINNKGEVAEMNTAFKLWPYFNYFMYLSVFYLSNDFDNANLESYAKWPYSPIPHEREATLWMTFVAFLWVFNFSLFFYLGKKKKVEEVPTEQVNESVEGIDAVKPTDSLNEEPKLD